jgi:hypothetical protein
VGLSGVLVCCGAVGGGGLTGCVVVVGEASGVV